MLRFFKPAGRKIARLLKEPAAKEVLKNIGKEAASTGTEILLKKLKRGQNLRSKSEERIKRAKKKISKSLNDTVKLKSKGSNIKYYKLDSDSDNDSFEYKRRNELITKQEPANRLKGLAASVYTRIGLKDSSTVFTHENSKMFF